MSVFKQRDIIVIFCNSYRSRSRTQLHKTFYSSIYQWNPTRFDVADTRIEHTFSCVLKKLNWAFSWVLNSTLLLSNTIIYYARNNLFTKSMVTLNTFTEKTASLWIQLNIELNKCLNAVFPFYKIKKKKNQFKKKIKFSIRLKIIVNFCRN